jgi:hypothetical protein
MKPSIIQLCPLSCDFQYLWLNILLDILSSNILSLWPFPNARGKFSHRHKQKAVNLYVLGYQTGRRKNIMQTIAVPVPAWRQIACGEGVITIAPHIPDLDCRCRGVVSFIIQPFYPQSPRCQLNRRLGGSRGVLDDFREQKISCPCLESARKLVRKQTTLSLSQMTISSAHNIILYVVRLLFWNRKLSQLPFWYYIIPSVVRSSLVRNTARSGQGHIEFLCFVERASRYIYVIKTNLMHYLSSVYFVNQPLQFHPNPANRQSTKKHNTYQLLCVYIYIQYTSWWWTTNMPETCRGWLMK